MDAIDFGRLVRARRKAKRLSQRDLAAAIDTGERFIVDLESGKPTCQLGKALSVARALGIVMADVSQHHLQPSDDDEDPARIRPSDGGAAAMSDEVPVYYETLLVGRIEVQADGPTFSYDPKWISTRNAFPISVRMPIAPGQVPPETLVPWLMNLLPEGNALPTLGRNLGVSSQDVVGLIKQIGRDTAGALSIGRPRNLSGPSYIPIPDEASLERIIGELPAKPFLAGQEGVSMSLAGAQEKFPVGLMDGVLSIPVNGAPSTHIIKPDISRLFGSVPNEALCMVLAKHVGQQVAEVTTGRAGERTYLLVKRYDRRERDGHLLRRHQEDFCQALGRPPSAKYERNSTATKGPGLVDFFTLARQHMDVTDINRLRDAIILNVLLTNVDSHSKNYSLMLSGRSVVFAPLYDLMCGNAWPHVTQNMAQSIAGKTRGKHIAARHWRRMATECGINGTALLRRVEELASQVSTRVDAAADEVRAMPAGDHPMLAEFVRAIRARCRDVTTNLRSDGPGEGADEKPEEEESLLTENAEITPDVRF